jgi:hypothetical protein
MKGRLPEGCIRDPRNRRMEEMEGNNQSHFIPPYGKTIHIKAGPGNV